MRYYIAYKFLDADKELLKNNLRILCNKIEKGNNSTFVFYRDAQDRGEINRSIDQVIKQAFVEIEKSDALIALVESKEKSEGMLLEIGYAKAKGKKLILIIKEGINLRFVRTLADKIVEFDDIENIKI